MAKKSLKSGSTRTPPLPAENHSGIDEWMTRRVMPDLQPIVKAVDSLIRETIPKLQYAVKWKRAYYGLPGRGWIIEIAPYDVSLNVVFFGGADLKPPPPLGDTGRTRYVKLKSLEEAQRPEIRKWIEQAARVSGWT